MILDLPETSQASESAIEVEQAVLSDGEVAESD
ncbi:hypothetical protein BH23PAT1_BH23PAT1_1510 [soil metagenome]